MCSFLLKNLDWIDSKHYKDFQLTSLHTQKMETILCVKMKISAPSLWMQLRIIEDMLQMNQFSQLYMCSSISNQRQCTCIIYLYLWWKVNINANCTVNWWQSWICETECTRLIRVIIKRAIKWPIQIYIYLKFTTGCFQKYVFILSATVTGQTVTTL